MPAHKRISSSRVTGQKQSTLILNKTEEIVSQVLNRNKQFKLSRKFLLHFNEPENKIQTLVSLGLGSPSSSLVSLEQLAVQVRLREELQIGNCVCFDPVFTAHDHEALSKLDCVVDSYFENYSAGNCLFFMPHCDKEVYVDVMRRRIACLENTAIIGNSFLLYERNCLGREHVFWRNLNECLTIAPFTLDPEPKHNSFSDTKLITFNRDAIPRIQNLLGSY